MDSAVESVCVSGECVMSVCVVVVWKQGASPGPCQGLQGIDHRYYCTTPHYGGTLQYK